MRFHSPDVCEAPCPLHAPSGHHMADWPLQWRPEKDMFERVCEHGIGHPDPDSLRRLPQGAGVHGCDGCCQPKEEL